MFDNLPLARLLDYMDTAEARAEVIRRVEDLKCQVADARKGNRYFQLEGIARERADALAAENERLAKALQRYEGSGADNLEGAEAIDRAARHLRETQQGGKRLTPWDETAKATKKKWLALAEGTLRAAAGKDVTASESESLGSGE